LFADRSGLWIYLIKEAAGAMTFLKWYPLFGQ